MRYFTVQYPVAPIPWKPAISALASSLPRPMTSGRIRIEDAEEGAGGEVNIVIRCLFEVQSLKVGSSGSAKSPTAHPQPAWWLPLRRTYAQLLLRTVRQC